MQMKIWRIFSFGKFNFNLLIGRKSAGRINGLEFMFEGSMAKIASLGESKKKSVPYLLTKISLICWKDRRLKSHCQNRK